jgi:hypothetical protein
VTLAEDDGFGYQIDNILLSAFVYPSWFESFRAEGSTQLDSQEQDSGSAAGVGRRLIGTFNLTSGSGWQQTTAEKHPTSLRNRGSVGARRERRNIPHDL